MLINTFLFDIHGNMCGGIPKGNPPNGGTIGKFGIIPPNAT
jgi:hypothetical protein